MKNTKELFKGIKWAIVLPLIIIVIAVSVVGYLDYKKNHKVDDTTNNFPSNYTLLEPISKDKNPRRSETITNLSQYGCASPETITPETLRAPDAIWKIANNGDTTAVSLGKYRIKNLAKTVLDISKVWIYFASDKLSTRTDKFYNLEKSYVESITLNVNGYKKEIKLGGDNYMFLELSDFPFGDIYPYDKNYAMEFEITLNLKCKNIQNGQCLDNVGKSLSYTNGADIKSQFRFFVLGCVEFTNDMNVNAKFSY